VTPLIAGPNMSRRLWRNQFERNFQVNPEAISRYRFPSLSYRSILGVIIALALGSGINLWAQSTSPVSGYGSGTAATFSAKSYGNSNGTPVVDLGFYQRPYDALQNQPIASLQCESGSGSWGTYSGWPSTTGEWIGVLSGRTDQGWATTGCEAVQMIIPIPTNTNGGQILVSQISPSGSNMKPLEVTVATGSSGSSSCSTSVSFTTRGQETLLQHRGR
jgi:hypothetical protein